MAIEFYDITEENQDIIAVNGDFGIEASNNQNIHDIIEAFATWWKEYPAMGCSAGNYLSNNRPSQEFERVILEQLQIDGFSDILVTPKIIDNQFSYQVTAIRQ
jgi:hypothetical protein